MSPMHCTHLLKRLVPPYGIPLRDRPPESRTGTVRLFRCRPPHYHLSGAGSAYPPVRFRPPPYKLIQIPLTPGGISASSAHTSADTAPPLGFRPVLPSHAATGFGLLCFVFIVGAIQDLHRIYGWAVK